MIRKLTGFVLAAVLLIALLPGAASAASTQCTWYSGTNINDQNYTVASAPIESYFVQTGSNELMRLQARAVTGQYLVEYYDTAYNLQRTVTVPEELGLFGGYYYDGSNHYILSGQNNPEESSEVEVYRLTKYDKNWNRLGSVGLYGANTCGPFSAGSARMDGDGTYLFVRTCHVMYASGDGLHHQANVTIQFNTQTMTVVDSYTGVMNISYGYVSHSFNQFMKLDNGYMVGVDHGDAHLRAVVLCKYKQPYGASGFTKRVSSVTMLPISGKSGDNATGVSVGGFEVTDSSYVVAGNSVDMGDGYSASAARNIFVSSVPRDLSADATITQLTNYTDADIRPSTPHLVKLGGNSLLLLWTYSGKLYYCKLDGSGNVTSQIYEAEGALSDCVPTLVNGKVIWYTWNNEVNTFYSLDAAHPETLETEKSVNGHQFDVTYATETNPVASQICRVCGYHESFTTLDEFYLWWWQGGSGSSGITRTPNEGDSYRVSLRYTAPEDCENTELELLTSDPAVMEVDGYSFRFVGAGTVTLTVQAKYRPSVKQVVTFTVQHDYEEEIFSNPTCTTPGSHRLTCRICGDVKTEEIPPLGHNMEVTSVTPATETNPYMKEFSTCTVCGHTESRDVRTMDSFYLWWWQGGSGYSGITRTPNEGDSYEVSLRYVAPEDCENTELELLTSDPAVMEVDGLSFRFLKAGTVTLTVQAKYRPSVKLTVTFHVQHVLGEATYIAPTCTQPGSTSRTCSVCHQVITDVEPALGHAWDNGVVTKEPTEASEGTITYACERCHETKTECLPKTPCPSAAYTDVNTGKWYHAGIDYVVSKGYMSGLSATTFGVNGQLTRAQFVTILYSVAGKPSVSGVSNPFTDVKSGKWYANAVLWAVSEGITGGTSATTFSPDDTVTRAQIAMFLYAYAGKPAVTGDALSGFTDADQIPSYARTAMNWAVSEGLISGTDAAHVSPKTVATRAQIAAIIMNFVEK